MDKFLLIAMIMLLTRIADCQTVTRPGDKDIRYNLINPGSDLYKIVMTDSSGKVLSEFSARITVSIDKTKGWVVLAQDHYFPDGRRLLDSTVADLHTLAPVRMRMVTSPHFMSMHLDFHSKDVHAVAEMGGHNTDTVHTMPEGYFDSNLIEYLFGLLPYHKGYQTRIQAYTFEENGVDPFEVSYIGQDMLQSPSKGLTWCYVAAVGHAGKGGGLAWYEQSTGKMLKRIVPMSKGYYIVTKV